MMVVYIAVMIAALAGMIVCSKKQETMPAAKALSIVLLIVVIGCGVMVMKDYFGDSAGNALRENENRFYAAQAFVVGDYAKNTLGGGKILLIADPSYKNAGARMEGFIAAMKKGLGGEVDVDTVELPAAGEDSGESVAERMTAKDFDAVIARHGDAKTVVSLIGLPRDLKNLKAIQNTKLGKGPALILLSADVPQMAQMIATGMVTAVVTVSQKAVFNEDPAPSDEKAAFAVRYILVDKNNVKENKGLFGI